MINKKNTRKSMIVLSVIVAVVICSFATIYTFAANTDNPQQPDYNENFYNELEIMYNELIAKDEFKGTFDDFKSDIADKFSDMSNLTKMTEEERRARLKELEDSIPAALETLQKMLVSAFESVNTQAEITDKIIFTLPSGTIIDTGGLMVQLLSYEPENSVIFKVPKACSIIFPNGDKIDIAANTSFEITLDETNIQTLTIYGIDNGESVDAVMVLIDGILLNNGELQTKTP